MEFIWSKSVNYFSFLKDRSLAVDVSYRYLSPFVEGASSFSEYSNFDINIKKTLWNKRASISFGIIDMFNTLNISRSTKYLNQDVLFNSRIENRLVTFGFNYKFGNFRLNSNKKEVDLDERDRLKN